MSFRRGAIRSALVALAVLSLGVPARRVTGADLITGPKTAPRFKAKDVAGLAVELDVLRRKGPVLLDFWATWCKPCLEALPELQRLHETYGPRGLTVVGISVDGPRNFSKVRPFARKVGLTYPIVIDQDERLRHLYQVIAMPTTVLIDTAGVITEVRLGYRPGEGDELEKRIAALLGPEAEEVGPNDGDASASESEADSTGGSKPR